MPVPPLEYDRGNVKEFLFYFGFCFFFVVVFFSHIFKKLRRVIPVITTIIDQDVFRDVAVVSLRSTSGQTADRLGCCLKPIV